MKKLLVIAFALAASPCLADPVLVQIEPPPMVSFTAWLDIPHAEDEPRVVADRDSASAAIEAHYGHRRHRHRRYR